jgi:hypothetical protein
MPIAWFWWYVRKKSLLKINSLDYVRETLAIAVSENPSPIYLSLLIDLLIVLLEALLREDAP